jgi:hypothetical protein
MVPITKEKEKIRKIWTFVAIVLKRRWQMLLCLETLLGAPHISHDSFVVHLETMENVPQS